MGGTATSFGYWVRRRRLALDLTQVALARRVGCSPAAVKKIEHDERRPSRTMATRLAEALGIGPDQQQRFVEVGVGEAAADRLGPVEPAADPGPAPSWLSFPLGTQVRPVVGRDDQLAQLRGNLDATLDGHGRTVFVSGEAGQGKTALLTAFADVAQHDIPELVVVRGAGTTAGGYGDPYLVVRDVFRTLVADPRAPWHADQLTPGQAKNLWAFAPTVARIVHETGPHLLDVVVPADTVRERLGGGAAPGGAAQASRDHVVAEVTDVLHALAAERPLLLLLDDMQWADTASAELLFHLARRLTDARALVVCAYRGSEVAPDAGPAAAALRQALQESRRDLADVHLDLDNVNADTERALCDAVLDLEIPDLHPDLHDEIYRRTRGHPLFVQELVHELKDRGDLIRRDDGAWAARADLDWDDVPARVAAVIQQRLDRLGAAERALLDAAAVEGEYFTVELAAQLAGTDERAARRTLTQLDRRHGLVRETGTTRVGARTLTRYRFGHALFQQFVYETLGAGDRTSLHGQLAGALETLYEQDPDPVVPQLAHHYAEAGDAERAVPYLTQVGDRARLLHAHDEAITAYERVARFHREAGERERLARTLMKIGLTYQTGFDHERAQPALDEAFTLWSSVDAVATGASESATLRLIWMDPESLDPTMGGYSFAAPVVTNLLSGLVRYDEGTNVVPDVAHRWEITDGGRRYVFHLRNDVYWTDGQPVTAHDFVFTYRRALDPATGARVAPSLLDAVTGARDIRKGRAAPSTAGIDAPDDHTLVIELVEPTSYFIYNLAYYVLLPVPQHTVKAHEADWWGPETMVSNGPFQLASWDPGRTMVLVRNPRYHGVARGNVHRVTLNLAVADAEHEALYLADGVDLVSGGWFTPADVITRLRRRFPAEYARRDRFVTFYYWWLDSGTPPLDDRRLRQAMAMAVDRDAVEARSTHGLALPATGGLVPPGMPGHVPDLAARYDPDEATRLVADTANSRELPELTLFCTRRGEPIAQQLSDGWQAVGIPCRLHRLDSSSELPVARDETAGPKIAFGGWVADYPDPDTFLRVDVELDLPGWRHNRYWSLLEQATRTADSAARLARYEKAERVLAEEAVIVPLTYEPENLMLKPWVTDYPTIPVKYPGFWKDVTIGPR
jgi:ABC-type transport system substrate-binding protein/transcriptional regulator with XRE-family HTH domain